MYNKGFEVHTSEGCFILKIECEKVFPSTRAGQTENEVESIRLFTQHNLRNIYQDIQETFLVFCFWKEGQHESMERVRSEND